MIAWMLGGICFGLAMANYTWLYAGQLMRMPRVKKP
jgi:hypothetical protein